MDDKERKALSYFAVEVIYKIYTMEHKYLDRYFVKLNMRDCIVMHMLDAAGQAGGEPKIYLKDIVSRLGIPTRAASNMARELSDKGLVSWSHDGDGSEGTYIVITDTGRALLREQEDITGEHFSNIARKYGYDKIKTVLDSITELDQMIKEDAERLPEAQKTV